MPHIHEKYDFVVNCFIINDGRVLLVNHKKMGTWLPLGGHIELDEDPEQALFKEIEEESGLTAEDIEIFPQKPAAVEDPEFNTRILFTPQFLCVHDVPPNHKHIALQFFARTKRNDVTLSESEHHDIKWFSKEDLDNPDYNVTEPIKFYAKTALDRA